MENDEINSLTNLIKYLLSAEVLSKWKTEFILPHLVRNFKSMEETNQYQSAF